MTKHPDTVRATLAWRWRHFNVFSGPEWHRLLRLRTAIFVVEQNCAYQEVDEKDPDCWHLEVTHSGELVGTLRVVPPGVSYQECSIGRVALREDYRGLGLGYDLMDNALGFCSARWPGDVRLSAQAYLQAFYESIGFAVIRGPYLEDGIPHIEMLRAGENSGS
jgi:ElaA protein